MNIGTYLWDRKILITLFTVCMIFTGAMIWLTEKGDLLLSNGFYAALVSLVLFAVYLICDYIRLSTQFRKLNALFENEGTDWIVSLPSPYTLDQQIYTKLLYKLKKDSDAQLARYGQKNAEDIDFLETWVHEIKTPIAASKLIIENSLNAPTEKTLYDILDEIGKIEDMVQKTLCYSQLNDFSRDCRVSRVDVQKLVNMCIQSEYSNIANKGIQLDIREINLEVISDAKWLQFIIKQLIDNAVKYSLQNGTIRIESAFDANEYTLIIRDFGVGIKKEDLRRVFEKGFTGFNGRTAYASTGVGLYLSQKLALKLGHTITISSELGQGTEVSLHFKKYEDA